MEAHLGKPKTLSITANSTFTIVFASYNLLETPIPNFFSYNTLVFACYSRQGCFNTLFTNNYWKEANTPWFISYN